MLCNRTLDVVLDVATDLPTDTDPPRLPLFVCDLYAGYLE